MYIRKARGLKWEYVLLAHTTGAQKKFITFADIAQLQIGKIMRGHLAGAQ